MSKSRERNKIFDINGEQFKKPFEFWQVNLTNANLEGATATGNTSFKGSNITGAGKKKKALHKKHIKFGTLRFT